MSDPDSKNPKDDRGKLVGGIIVAGIGLVFLLSNLDIIPHIGRTWPLILIVVGFALLVGALRRRDQSEPKSFSSQ
jgi:cytochrome c-type biogenesis protein CcmH/NrfF